ncbi:serine hydrolase domain-containing protein [Kitasatospora sp. NPDC097691]|uniref:serine hydrolase domain-containing protein n=1 Tax=Kitasatospora sp. NPDC097691 TaxID=3157231 RepID=UPI0033166736
MTRHRIALLCAATVLLFCTPQLAGTEPAGATGQHGPECVSSPTPAGSQGRALLDIVERDQQDLKLRAVIARVTRNGREVWTGAVGPSMTDVPARPDMRFRVGNVGIAFMGTVLLQLVDEGRVGLDDPLSRWMPEIPHSDEITLRMLADTTSGIRDYVTAPGFADAINAQPFKQWSPQELLAVAHPDDLLYRPGTNWNYSHTNFLLLGEALERITDTRLDHLLEQRIHRPLGLRSTSNSYTPDIPAPVLHAFTAQRGMYEESTFWNPSWTTAPGAVITMDVCDLARAGAGIGSGQTLVVVAVVCALDGCLLDSGPCEAHIKSGAVRRLTAATAVRVVAASQAPNVRLEPSGTRSLYPERRRSVSSRPPPPSTLPA